jgi:predicted NBD/HSP70 family sugar kinase
MEAVKQANAPWDRVHRIVLGTPGVVDPASGDIAFAVDLPQWHHGLRDALNADLDRPVSFENDVNLAAIAEARLGAARGVSDFALVWISRGVGVAIVLGGRLHRGTGGAAGEIGYLYVPGGQPPDFARRGNPRGVLPAFQQTINESTVRELAHAHGFKAPTAPEAVAAVIAGGGAGEPVLDELAQRVALGVLAVAVVLDPSLIVIAGDVGSAGGDRLAKRVQEHVARLAPVSPRVVVTEVPGEPVLQGALLTALDDTREEVFAAAAAVARA